MYFSILVLSMFVSFFNFKKQMPRRNKETKVRKKVVSGKPRKNRKERRTEKERSIKGGIMFFKK